MMTKLHSVITHITHVGFLRLIMIYFRLNINLNFNFFKIRFNSK